MILGRIIAEFIRLYWRPCTISISEWLTGTFKFGGFIVTRANVIICVVSAIVVAALQCFLTFKRLEKQCVVWHRIKKRRPLWELKC